MTLHGVKKESISIIYYIMVNKRVNNEVLDTEVQFEPDRVEYSYYFIVGAK